MSSSISVKPKKSPAEDTANSLKKALPKAYAPNSKAAVLFEALAATKQGFWVGQKKREKKVMRGSWGVGTLLTRFSVTPMNPMS